MVTLTKNVSQNIPPMLRSSYSYTYEKIRGLALELTFNRQDVISDIYRELHHWGRIQHAYEAMKARQKFEATIRRKRSLMEFRKRRHEELLIPDMDTIVLRGPLAARYIALWRKRLEKATADYVAARCYFEMLTDKQRKFHLL